MPKCKYCHENISRLSKDICPLCGGLRPIEGLSDTTEDFTTTFDAVKTGVEIKKYKSRIVAGIFAIFLGIFGINGFYLKKPLLGITQIIISLIMIVGGGCTLYFTKVLPNAFGFLIPLFVVEAFMIALGIVYFIRRDIKDGEGGDVR